MFERWTDRARRIAALAENEARMAGHDHVGTEHFLLGMVREGECVAAQALKVLGVPGLEDLREQAYRVVPGGRTPALGHIPWTPRVKKVCELALREALQLGCSYIGTEHVLLALEREGQGTGMKVLQSLGIEHADVRDKVLELLRGYKRSAGDSLPPLLPSPLIARLDEILDRLGGIERHLGIAAAGDDSGD